MFLFSGYYCCRWDGLSRPFEVLLIILTFLNKGSPMLEYLFPYLKGLLHFLRLLPAGYPLFVIDTFVK